MSKIEAKAYEYPTKEYWVQGKFPFGLKNIVEGTLMLQEKIF
jgi:hypothetical protein